MGRKLGWLCPFGEGSWAPSNRMWPGSRPTCVTSCILIRPTVWPQYTNITDRQERQDRTEMTTVPYSHSIGRTVLQTVAQKLTRANQLLKWATVWPQETWAEKWGGGCCAAGSPLDPQLTQCGLGRGLPVYQVVSWSIQPFSHSCRNATLPA